MSCWGVTANPVRGRAENQVPVAVFSTRERAMEYIEASRVEGDRPLEGGYWRSFRRGSLLYDFNGVFVGDYHPPERDLGYWVVNPCTFDVQLHELDDSVLVTSLVPVDPAAAVGMRTETETP